MKFHRFASTSVWTVTLLLLAFSANPAFAQDEDLPPPGGFADEIPLTPGPQPDLEEENLPAPTLGEEGFPEPSMDNQRNSNEYQVNPYEAQDEVFLPTPMSQDNVNYAPLGSPVSNRNLTDADWRLGMDNRPVFSLHGGMGVYNYPTEAVAENISGPTVGASYRVFNIAQTVFLHAYASFGWASLGLVGPFPETKDTILHLGGMLEVGLGRRLSLFGSLLRRNHTLSSDPDPNGIYRSVEDYSPELVNEGFKLGIGIQYDFYVIPHGSLGVRAHLEQDMGLVALTMALEPQPRKKLNLNFREM